ncbi:MAG: hypothetical protein O3C40_03285 [Planctomycetota bacterium]|nr:hypothetical protein [Planctomycetota bacterium]
MYQSLRSIVRVSSLATLSSIALLVISAGVQAQVPRAALKTARAKATTLKPKPTRPIKAVRKDAVVGNKKDLPRKTEPSIKSKLTQPITAVRDQPKPPIKWHPPTELAIQKKRVLWSNVDYYFSYGVVIENRGPYDTLLNRTVQVVTFDSNGTKTVGSKHSLPTGLKCGETWEFGPIHVPHDEKLLWVVVLDGKDKNGWNDFIILRDNR